MTCPHCGEPLATHGAACRPEAFRRITTGPPRCYSYSWHPRPRDAEREAQQAEARAILAEWCPDDDRHEFGRRVRALLERVARMLP